MRLSFVVILGVAQVIAAATTTKPAVCNRDDCLRAVVASSFPTRSGAADCSSFFRDTVTPATVTITKTKSPVATITSTFTVTPAAPGSKREAAPEAALEIVPRQVTASPTSIPTYASACSGSVRYSSACSCIGATHTTTTAKAPTTTTTISTTVTVTECASPFPTFILQLENSGIVLNGVHLDGTYGQFDDGDGPILGFNGAPRSDAIILSLNAAGNLVMDQEDGLIAYSDYGQSMEILHFGLPADVYATADPAICSVAGGQLKCSTGAPQILMLCPGEAVTNDVFIAVSLEAPPCVSPTFKVVPLCVVPTK